MRVVPAAAEHLDGWAAMRAQLWPDDDVARHRGELVEMLGDGSGDLVAFLALDEQDAPIGFVEAAVRRDYVNGCDTSPVGFVEGLYVAPHARRRGVARALVGAVEDCARGRGFSELGSDALADNGESHALHAAIGFEETERVVFFRRLL